MSTRKSLFSLCVVFFLNLKGYYANYKKEAKDGSKQMGLFIKTCVKKKAFYKEQLAETLGVSNRSISRWENGANMPDFDIVIHLAKFFNVSIEETNGEKKEDIVNKEKEEAMLKVSDYENESKTKCHKMLDF